MPCLDITIGEAKKSDESHHFVYPSATRPRRTRAENTASAEFIRLGRVAEGLAVNYYSFTLGRLVVAKRRSRCRGIYSTLDFCNVGVYFVPDSKQSVSRAVCISFQEAETCA